MMRESGSGGRHTGLRHRADRGALRLVVEALAFGAFVGVDDIDKTAHADRLVGTVEFAGAATGAQRSDDLIRHDFVSGAERRGHGWSGFRALVYGGDPGSTTDIGCVQNKVGRRLLGDRL